MNKFFFLIFMFFFMLCLHADYLSDFEVLLKEIDKDYDNAVNAEQGSRIARDYESKLNELENIGRKIQEIILKLNIGRDFHFAGYSSMIKNSYNANAKKMGLSNMRSIEKKGGRDFPLSMLNADIAELKKIKFTTDNGGSYDARYMPSPGLMEFERLLNYYARVSRRLGDSNNDNTLWRSYFERNMARMKSLAVQINIKLLRTDPDILKICNFSSETNVLTDSYFKLSLSSIKNTNPKKSIENPSSARNRISQEVNYSIKKLKTGLRKLNEINFELELSKPDKNAQELDDDPIDLEDTSELNNLSDRKLAEMIDAIREEIYKYNNLTSGVSDEILKVYTQFLSKKARDRYNEIRKKYSELNYNPAVLKNSSFLQLRGELKSGHIIEPRDELIKLIERYQEQKDKINETLSSDDTSSKDFQWK